MSIQFINIFLILILIIASAFFSCSETAFMAINRLRLRYLSKKDKRAKIIYKLLKKPEKLLGTILLGNNLVNIAASAIAASLFIAWFGSSGIFLATITMTGVILIFAEIIPKTLAAYFPEKIAMSIIWPMKFFIIIFSPVVKISTWISIAFHRLFGITIPNKIHTITKEDIYYSIEMGIDEGIFKEFQQDMLAGIFDIEKLCVRDVMVPLNNVISINSKATFQETMAQIKDTNFSRFPVYDDTPDNFIGYIHIRSLIFHDPINKFFDLTNIMMKPFFIPETKTVEDQLIDFQKTQTRLAFVTSEYGRVLGIVSLRDVLEEIVGDMRDEHEIKKRKLKIMPDGFLICPGTLTIREIKKQTDLIIPAPVPITMAGLIMRLLGRIPEQGEIIEWEGFTFKILKRDGNALSSIGIKQK